MINGVGVGPLQPFVMFSNLDSAKKKNFIETNQNARLQRAEEKKRENAAVKIQANIRRYLAFNHLKRTIWYECDKVLTDPSQPNKIKRKTSAMAIYKVTKKLLFIYGKDKESAQKLELIYKVILFNMESENDPKYWYTSMMLSKDHTVSWIQQLKNILNISCKKLRVLNPYLHRDSETASTFLSMMMTFTSCKDWKILQMKGGKNIEPIMEQLCSAVLNDLISKGLYVSLEDFLLKGLARSAVGINKKQISSVTSMSLRPLILSQFSKSTTIVFILHILSLPAFTLRLQELSSECLTVFDEHEIVKKVLLILSDKQDMRIIFNSLEGNKALCLIGNIVHMMFSKPQTASDKNFDELRSQFMDVLISLLWHCQTYVVKKQSNLTKWHPLLGWFMQAGNNSWIAESTLHVTTQLRLLWNSKVVEILFSRLPKFDEEQTKEGAACSAYQKKSTEKGLFKRRFTKSLRNSTKSGLSDLKDPVVLDVSRTCELFQLLASTLTQLKMEIFAALSLNEKILIRLWRFLYALGPDGGLKLILGYITGASDTLPDSLVALLTLFCDCCSQLLPIIDDVEFYEQQKPFTLDDSIKMSAFLNSLVFKIIWTRCSNDESKSSEKNDNKDLQPRDSTFLHSALTLLLLLYDRDCRRSFTPPQHWIVKELKTKHFLSELTMNKRRPMIILKKIPHVLPHSVRVQIFREWVESDKESLGIVKDSSRPNALVTIHRNRLLEDGYEQLSRLDGQNLKGIIRVKFINEQGLDEAGIDQDGVFKEFLEDTITKAFDPQLNLFKMTTDQQLYPSSTSFIQDSHLHLFEFVGKMLGKAVYEGILVDIPFASFFTSQLLCRQHGALYSSIDELPSLDPEMYKSLCFIKNYDGDISDLELTYSYDEDVLGKVETHDLKPGGRAIKVTNANKFAYIHLMAKFRLSTHIKEQTAAFIRGFRSIVNLEWLIIFSPPEFQRLISGDTGEIDFVDLKQTVQYYGGYHPGHDVILWLWDILQNDFNKTEKKQFLKFVTSCSNPPLLGFRYLEPAFTIRYVECSDEDDTGDSAASVFRGFFGVRKRGRDSGGRLPTASTCFNLLKLPNYKKKSLLREKLRYAITSGAGFELS